MHPQNLTNYILYAIISIDRLESRLESVRHCLSKPKEKAMSNQEVKIVRDPLGDDTIYFHCSRRLSQESVHDPNGSRGEKKSRALLKSILNIAGVQEARVDRYKVKVEKSKAFEWETLASSVEETIRRTIEEAKEAGWSDLE